MSQFTQGQKVVLDRNFDPETRASAPGDGITLLEMGQVYTVRAVTDITGFGDVLFLEEIVNPTKFYFDAFQIMEQGFDPTRFRLVTRHNPAPISLEAISAWVATVEDFSDVSETSDEERLSIEEIDAINHRWKDWCGRGGYIEPLKEVEAVSKAIYNSLDTDKILRGFAAQFGIDIDEVDVENTRDRARLAYLAALCQKNWGAA